MSVQFGRWNFGGKPVDPAYLEEVGAIIAPYGPDDRGCLLDAGLTILYHALQTTKESRRETQPHRTESGSVLVWDGRLDNRAELMSQVADRPLTSTDAYIVGAAYEKWGIDCFGKLIGDWALSIWDPKSRALVLAKDPIGTRHLYYAVDEHQVTWTSVLDPLVLFAGRSFSLSAEYLAGWLSLFPATHLTAFEGILSVPPASFVLIQREKCVVRAYWNFDRGKRIRYRTDLEYEEHFRTVFATAVQRRLRSDRPILAELSGGRDSSSIVCVADALLARTSAETPRLDTVSCYTDSEPNWNERPYFAKVEEQRGCAGYHIAIGGSDIEIECPSKKFSASPAWLRGPSSEARRGFSAWMASQEHAVLLSGIGGDEVTGGVSTTVPEFQDLLVTGRFKLLACQLKIWALYKKVPWFHLLLQALRGFVSSIDTDIPTPMRSSPWLTARFRESNRAALSGYETRTNIFRPLPSFQENLSTLAALQRQLSCIPLALDPPHERRYPYLDRDLLEFLFSIPREQLVRPGQCRSLMRRALAGIVPDEILNRKRKAFVVRTPLLALSKLCANASESRESMLSAALGIVDQKGLIRSLQGARNGEAVAVVGLLRTIALESWLRNQRDWNGLLSTCLRTAPQYPPSNRASRETLSSSAGAPRPTLNSVEPAAPPAAK
jgi:asparagine synthase (glutamine-hydrolysing)